MENFWTSKNPIKGLSHFVLVNEIKKRDKVIVSLVSVIDVEINLKIPYEELLNSSNWVMGWTNLPKFQSITKDYLKYKSARKARDTKKFFINDDSLFYIS